MARTPSGSSKDDRPVAGAAAKTVSELPDGPADATGLTPVHVNRTLKNLEREGLIKRDRRFVAIPAWEALRRAAGFSETYLHLDQASPAYAEAAE